MVLGGPGHKSGVALRLTQALLSLLSFLIMFIAPNFAHVTAFRYLLKSQGVQIIWSAAAAAMDFKTAAFGGPRRRPSPFRVTVTCVLDWCTSGFSLGTLSAAGAAASWLGGTTICDEPSTCRMFLVSVVFAVLAWCLQAYFSVIMFMFVEAAFS